MYPETSETTTYHVPSISLKASHSSDTILYLTAFLSAPFIVQPFICFTLLATVAYSITDFLCASLLLTSTRASMSSIQGTEANGSKSTATISHESLLEASELLQDNLGSSDLTSRSIRWDNFPALMKLWEVLWQAQASMVQEAERLANTLEDLSQQDTRLQEVRADLDEIRAGKHEERDRHFALSLYWRRHVSTIQAILSTTDTGADY